MINAIKLNAICENSLVPYVYNKKKINEDIQGMGHSHEALPSRGTKRSRDEEFLTMTKQTKATNKYNIDHEIFSMFILSLPLIQEGQFIFCQMNVYNTG